jgi:hypothetical protein
MSMMIHRKREELKRKAKQMQNRESSTPDVMTGAVVADTAPVVDNVEEGEDIVNPAPAQRGRKKKV